MSEPKSLIVLEPEILAGKPIVAGTRISVEMAPGLIAAGWSETDILADYPTLDRERILACVAYARDFVASKNACASAV